MHTKIPRKLLPTVEAKLSNNPAVALLGPRQVGKSTLANIICEKYTNSLYLDLERDKDRAMLNNIEAFFSANQHRLICLDEIQRTPEIFPFIRGYLDRNDRNGQLLVLGSASRDLIQQSSETLAGRISYQEITPFLSSEIPRDDLRQHWLRGGFPRSYLANDDDISIEWRFDYIRSFLERDIPNLGFNIPAEKLNRFWRMLAHVHSQTLNASKLGASMGISSNTIRSYIDILEQTFLIRVLMPFEINIKKRLIKSPKIFIRDSGLLHALLDIDNYNNLLSNPIYGASFEGYIIENILSNLPRWRGYFYRTSNGTEVDLILQKGNTTIAVEIKSSATPTVSKGFYNTLNEINVDNAFVIGQIESSYPLKNDVTATNLHLLLSELGTGKNLSGLTRRPQ